MSNGRKLVGMLAQFDGPNELLAAAEKVRDAGYKKFDCHSPFPIHGMDAAMGLKRSPLGWIIGLFAFIGGSFGFWLQWWTSAVDYPMIVSGKPFFSFQAYVPITFAFAVIGGAFAATFGMLILNRLPQLHHEVFYSDRFKEVTDGGFFVSILADDPKFDHQETQKFMESIGGSNVEPLEE